MATLKHINSKNADYGAAEQYLLFEHDEFTMKPVLDETGRLMIRSCLPIGIELIEIPEQNGIPGFLQLLFIAVYGVFRDTAHWVSCAVCHRAGGHCQVADFCGSLRILIEKLIKVPQ